MQGQVEPTLYERLGGLHNIAIVVSPLPGRRGGSILDGSQAAFHLLGEWDGPGCGNSKNGTHRF